MDSFKIGIFDLFSSILPGIPILVLLGFVIGFEPFEFNLVYEYISNLNLNLSLFLLTLSYFIGFSIQYISYETFQKLLKKNSVFWKKRIGEHSISIGKRGKEITLIRHYSPDNFVILNTFMALRTMCYNMFFSILFFAFGILILSLIKFEFNKDFFIVFTLSLLFSILFLRRAVSFHEWIQNLISECEEITNKEFKNTK
jgi:hypothetical protein